MGTKYIYNKIMGKPLVTFITTTHCTTIITSFNAQRNAREDRFMRKDIAMDDKDSD